MYLGPLGNVHQPVKRLQGHRWGRLVRLGSLTAHIISKQPQHTPRVILDPLLLLFENIVFDHSLTTRFANLRSGM